MIEPKMKALNNFLILTLEELEEKLKKSKGLAYNEKMITDELDRIILVATTALEVAREEVGRSEK